MPDKLSATDVPTDLGFALDELVRRVAHAMDPQATFADHEDVRAATLAQGRADDLARLRAIEALRADLASAAHMIAHRAGGRTAAPVTYADLGEAVGISRQAATGRWPGAVPDAKPGRPRKAPPQVSVYLTGGPLAWDGTTQEFDMASIYERDLDNVGAYLVVPGEELPDYLEAGVDWRAHYAPDSEDDRVTWVFQGWVPS